MRSPRPLVTLALAAAGFGLNMKAWLALIPYLYTSPDVGVDRFALMMVLPLLVGALVRLPVGVLTDRYGAGVMFPAVSLVAAASLGGLGLATSLPAAMVAGSAAGVGAGAFVVGGTLVSRAVPYGRRGTALGVFTLGVTVTLVLSAVLWRSDPDRGGSPFVIAGLLVAFAALAAVVFRDDRGYRSGPVLGRCVTMLRLAGSTSLSLLYALALGGSLAIGVFLPVYLARAYGLEWRNALAANAVIVPLAAAGRLAGGWWTDRYPTPRLLTVCYAVGAGLCLVVAAEPPLWSVAAPAIAGLAICDGVASGALLALIGKATRPGSAGAVMGVTGAVGAVGGLVPPLLLAEVDRLTRSYAAAWVVFALMLLGVALYVHAHDLRVGLGLAVRAEPVSGPTALTIAVVGESETRLGAAAVVARMADLAANDELVVVYGSDGPARFRLSPNALAAGLRDRLPRHNVVALRVAPYARMLERDAARLGEFVETGGLAIAFTSTAALRDVTAELSAHLKADRVLRVSFSPAQGAGLHQVWHRNP